MGHSNSIAEQSKANAEFEKYITDTNADLDKQAAAAWTTIHDNIAAHYAPFSNESIEIAKGSYKHVTTLSEWSLDNVSKMIKTIQGAIFGTTAQNVPGSTTTSEEDKNKPGVSQAILAMSNLQLLIANTAFNAIQGILESFTSTTKTELMSNSKVVPLSPGLTLFLYIIENNMQESRFFKNEMICQNFYLYECRYSLAEGKSIINFNQLSALADIEAAYNQQEAKLATAIAACDPLDDKFLEKETKFAVILKTIENNRADVTEKIKALATTKANDANAKLSAPPLMSKNRYYYNEIRQLRGMLSKIADLASSAASKPMEAPTGITPKATCTARPLPIEHQIKAAQKAVDINPQNYPAQMQMLRGIFHQEITPEHIALITGRRWPPTGVRLTVGFFDNPEAELRRKILSNMNAWGKTANVEFVESGVAQQVIIARETQGEMAGYWSWLGIDILHYSALGQPTMNLQGFTLAPPESEFRRVIRHETGHTLGFPHEHMRGDLVNLIDKQKAYDYFFKLCGWTPQMVDAQVLTPLDSTTLEGTPTSDRNSIMCYEIPGEVTKDGKPIVGGVDIDETDALFAARWYPKPIK